MIQRLLPLALPLWMLLSLLLWRTLTVATLLSLTPWVCGGLLASIGLIIGRSLRPLAARKTLPGFYAVALAAVAAPPIALVFAAQMHRVLLAHPIIEVASLMWLLSSMGTALTILVCRLLQTTGVDPVSAREIPHSPADTPSRSPNQWQTD